jgi:hypothetical protein
MTTPCAQYAIDLNAKLNSCGIATTPPAANIDAMCTPTLANQAKCREACLPKIDCACTKQPSGAGCAATLKPYSDCLDACG